MQLTSERKAVSVSLETDPFANGVLAGPEFQGSTLADNHRSAIEILAVAKILLAEVTAAQNGNAYCVEIIGSNQRIERFEAMVYIVGASLECD